jgi:hypothetical protein
MRPFRVILTGFLALLFVFSTNRCAIAAAFSGVVECCEDEQTPGDSERGLPCNEKGCGPCITLETGVNLAALVPLVLPAPVFTEVREFTELLQRLATVAVTEAPSAPPEPAAIPPPPWHDLVKKALPVRGPSFAA